MEVPRLISRDRQLQRRTMCSTLPNLGKATIHSSGHDLSIYGSSDFVMGRVATISVGVKDGDDV
ncbi:hypothetical protein DXG01_002287 [Tephrocybe rancida]|nr:hypothetical protein DXG01_002287 [Tephrocybe rancida]